MFPYLLDVNIGRFHALQICTPQEAQEYLEVLLAGAECDLHLDHVERSMTSRPIFAHLKTRLDGLNYINIHIYPHSESNPENDHLDWTHDVVSCGTQL